MVIRGEPKDKVNYVCIKNEGKIFELHRLGYQPTHINEDGVWFKTTKQIEKLLNLEA